MPRFFHRRLGSATPPQIAELPLDALQSQLYPVYPDIVNSQQPTGQLPIGLPQRMMFTRWKSGAASMQFAQEAKGYVSARDFGDQHTGPIQTAANVPPVRQSPATLAASMGATTLPAPNIDPNIYGVPLAKGYVPQERFLTGDQLSALIDDSREMRELNARTASVQASNAMQEISAVRSAIFDRIRPTGGETPWYMRR